MKKKKKTDDTCNGPGLIEQVTLETAMTLSPLTASYTLEYLNTHNPLTHL